MSTLVFLVQEFHVTSAICSGNQYTVKDADGKVLKCQSCAVCQEGYGLMEPKCGSTVQSPVKNSCERCPNGTFSDKNDSGPCYKCQACEIYQIVISDCNNQADTNCSQNCHSNYYFDKDVQACRECSYCCGDEKDEEQGDCSRQGLNKTNQHCSHRVDKNCAPGDLSTDISSVSSNGKKQLDEPKTLAIIFGSLGGVAVVGLVVCVAWKRRQSSDEGQDTEQVAQDIPVIVVADANSVTCK